MDTRKMTRREILRLMTAGAAGASVLATVSCVAPMETAAPAAEPAMEGFDFKRFDGESLFIHGENHPISELVAEVDQEFLELTGISLEWELAPEAQARQKTLLYMQGQDTGLDVWETAIPIEKLKFQSEGWYFAINDLLKDPNLSDPDWDADDIAAAGWQWVTLDNGDIYALPSFVPQIIYAFRRDLLEEKGIEPPKTLEEMEAAADALHDPPNMYGITLRGKAAVWVMWGAFLWNMGGSWQDEDGNLAIATPEAIAAAETYVRLLQNYGPPGSTGYDWLECSSLFSQGQAGMWVDGSDLIAKSENPENSVIADKIGYSLLPEGPGGQFGPVACVGWAISPFSQKKEASFYFLQWATNKSNQLRAMISGSPAARVSAWEHPDFAANSLVPQDWIDTCVESLKDGVAVPMIPEIIPVNEFGEAVSNALTQAIEGGDVAQLLQDAQDELEPVMQASQS